MTIFEIEKFGPKLQDSGILRPQITHQRRGRLYHHLAVLAQPDALQQLFFYYKALSVAQPFIAIKESILTLPQPVLEGKQARRLPVVIIIFIKVHAIFFTRKSQDSFRRLQSSHSSSGTIAHWFCWILFVARDNLDLAQRLPIPSQPHCFTTIIPERMLGCSLPTEMRLSLFDLVNRLVAFHQLRDLSSSCTTIFATWIWRTWTTGWRFFFLYEILY